MTIQVANVTSAGNTVYTSTGNTAITWLSLCNHNAANTVYANVCVVPNGGTPSVNNIVLVALELTGSETYQIYNAGEKLLLSNGDSIHIVANANTVTSVTSYTTI
jgi:quercetin dioxygenase-like cupin family protein